MHKAAAENIVLIFFLFFCGGRTDTRGNIVIDSKFLLTSDEIQLNGRVAFICEAHTHTEKHIDGTRRIPLP